MVFDIRDYGAAVDGQTDDSDAIMKAFDAAAPSGTVYFPAGDILIGSSSRIGLGLQADHNALTLEGAGYDQTRIVMAGGHDKVHFGIDARVSSAVDSLSFRDLTLDGNGLAQDNRIGIGVEVENVGVIDAQRTVFANWGTNGVVNRTADATFDYCTFDGNGQRAAEDGYAGHGVVVLTESGVKTVANHCLFQRQTGQAMNNDGGDNGLTGGWMEMRDCAVVDGGGMVKYDQSNERTAIINSRASNMKLMGIKNNPGDGGGTLYLDNVLIENCGWPGIDLPATGTVTGDMLEVRNVSTEDNRNAGLYSSDGLEWNFGRVSIHETSGDAVKLYESSGSIDEVVYGSTPGSLGPTSGVSVASSGQGDPLGVSVPALTAVGASADTSTSDSTTDDGSTDTTSTSYGGYQTPEKGTLDWHVPVNENFESIEADILDIAKRLDDLEG